MVDECNIEIFKWSQESTLHLIEIYKKYGILWNPKHPRYKNRTARKLATLEIANSLHIDKSEVERKIKNLTSHYLRELKKESETDLNSEVYKSKWFAYEPMKFLSIKPLIKRKRINDTKNESQKESSIIIKEEIEETGENSDDSMTDHASTRSASSSHNVDGPSISNFSEYIASKVRLMDKKTRAIVEYEINSIIFKAEMGYYSGKKLTCVASENSNSSSNECLED